MYWLIQKSDPKHWNDWFDGFGQFKYGLYIGLWFLFEMNFDRTLNIEDGIIDE